jgi:hypothetical protein
MVTVTSSGRLQSGGKHRKKPSHRKAAVLQRVSATRLAAVVVAAAVATAVLACAGSVATQAKEGPVPAADRPIPSEPARVQQAPNHAPDVGEAAPLKAVPAPFPSDDRGFIDSSARCHGSQPAYAIGRTPGSLVVICGEQAGQYEYLGVRLSDAAVLRTRAQTDSARSFLAQRAGVLYAISPTELKVTAGGTVIKQEPMIEYREVPR